MTESVPTPTTGTMWFASFDIGKKNFAFCIEEVNVSSLHDISNIPLHQRYLKDGTYTDSFKDIIRRVCSNGRIILLENVDLTHGCNKQYLDPKVLINMTHVVDEYTLYWDQ